jgi:hypothetical protein
MDVAVLTWADRSYYTMLQSFVERYNEADIVSGHYIRKHDLPMINGALIELGLAPLSPKLTSDTYLDFPKHGDISVSQEALAELLGIAFPKTHMSQNDWREANRLTARGVDKTIKRARTDVMQNMAIRQELLARNLLKPPKIWKS